MKQEQGGERNFCLPAVTTSYTYDIFLCSRRISGSLVLTGMPRNVVFTSALEFLEEIPDSSKKVEWNGYLGQFTVLFMAPSSDHRNSNIHITLSFFY